jgi:hypothetical protein
MIVNEFYNTQGLGNQLWCYVVTCVLAIDKGFDFGIMSPEKFRGIELMDLDYGLPVEGVKSDTWSTALPNGITSYYREQLIRNQYGIDVSPMDTELLKISDNTKIDGNFQSLRYIQHRRNEIIAWLKIKNNIMRYSSDNITVIHLRGGDYVGSPADSLLPKSYYLNAMSYMKSIEPEMKFYVVTDDLPLANTYFKGIAEMVGSTITGLLDPHRASHHGGGHVGVDYSILNNAKNIIAGNSTFSFWAAWTNLNLKNIIAPKYWFTFNNPNDFWSTNDMKVDGWKYLDRNGGIE